MVGIYEPQLLAEFENTAGLSAGNKWTPTPKKLGTHERWEVVWMEIFPPVSAGTPEALERVYPVVDGQSLESYVNLPAYHDYLITPPKNLIYGRVLFTFGKPASPDPLANTTLKVSDRFAVEAFAGASDVTQPFKVRVWGYRYEDEEALRRAFGAVYGGSRTAVEQVRNKSLTIPFPTIEVTEANFSKFAGGVHQDTPKIYPFVRYAKNDDATTANQPYEFRYETGKVENTWEELYFDFSKGDKALIVTHVGVRDVANLKYMWFNLDEIDYPYYKYLVEQGYNDFHFGKAYPYRHSDDEIFFPLPKLEKGYLIHNEIGKLLVQDNGTSISADSIIVALAGKFIQLTG